MRKYENKEINMKNIQESYKNDFKDYSNENLIRIKKFLNQKFESKISFSKVPGREFAISQLNEFMKSIEKKESSKKNKK